MSEHKVGEFVRQHKKAELAIGLGGAAVGLSAFLFGRRALEHRHRQQKMQGTLYEVGNPERYRRLLAGFQELATCDETLRTSLYAAAAQIYTDTKYTSAAVVTTHDIHQNGNVDGARMPDILERLDAFVGTPDQPNLFGKRENPKRLAGEGAPEGYYALLLNFTDGGLEKELAPDYYDEVERRLAWLDTIGSH